MPISQIAPDRPLIIWEPSGAAPAGYIKANGAAISRTAYAWLFGRIGTTYGAGDGATTFNVPDLRGEFLRGLDDGRGVDAGRVNGTAQADQLKAHTHAAAAGATGASGGYGYFAGNDPTVSTGSTGGTETRPRNVAGLYCIAYAP